MTLYISIVIVHPANVNCFLLMVNNNLLLERRSIMLSG